VMALESGIEVERRTREGELLELSSRTMGLPLPPHSQVAGERTAPSMSWILTTCTQAPVVMVPP